MKAFEYVAPTSVEGAVDRLEERAGESLPLAGGIAVGMLLAFTRTRPQGKMEDILMRRAGRG